MITDIKQHEIMDAFNKMIPYFKTFFEDDIMIGIYNTKNSLVYTAPDSMRSTYRAGDRVPEGSAAYAAIKEKKVIQKYVGKEVYGVPIKSIAIPLTDDIGQVIGSIDIGKSLKKQTEISDLSQDLSSSLTQITSALGQISVGIQNAGKSSEDILKNIKSTNDKTKDTDSVLEFIRNVANKTNLLGLNAAIESSRAGEAGKGFSVVAKEIRKLSSSSSESIKKIESVIKEIQQSVSTITGNVDEVNEVFQDQAVALEEIMSSIEKLNETTKILQNMADKL